VAGASKGLRFVIVGKANMTVVQDAQGIAQGERAVVRERSLVMDMAKGNPGTLAH